MRLSEGPQLLCHAGSTSDKAVLAPGYQGSYVFFDCIEHTALHHFRYQRQQGNGPVVLCVILVIFFEHGDDIGAFPLLQYNTQPKLLVKQFA